MALMSSSVQGYVFYDMDLDPNRRAFHRYMTLMHSVLLKMGHRMGVFLPVVDRNFINDPGTRQPELAAIAKIDGTCKVCHMVFRGIFESNSRFVIRSGHQYDQIQGKPMSFLHVISFEPTDIYSQPDEANKQFAFECGTEFICSRLRNFL